VPLDHAGAAHQVLSRSYYEYSAMLYHIHYSPRRQKIHDRN